ncbi:MAG: RnfABCDGE type electron transport complex subunit D [Candidatus Aenigmarchaeota archaeon]|nr:RnfABCDGE type electron transport complex subunit D [Candidatus Aenigmarchaeota archaeon]
MKYAYSMYTWAIIFLSLLVVVASYIYRTFPLNIFIAVITTSVLDVLLKKFFLKRAISFPSSAIITGLIIGSIAPINSSFLVVLLASFVAILSKYLIRIKGSHIFNPATLGLLVSLFAFSLGDEWWAAIGFNYLGYTLTLTPLLILPNFKARKLAVSIPFLVIVGLLYYFTGFITISSNSVQGIVSFLVAMPYYFGFIMVSEPKTSPFKTKQQVAFGLFVGILTFVLSFYSIKFALFIALLIGNLIYFLYRNYLAKTA